jgi:hypothetical protein
MTEDTKQFIIKALSLGAVLLVLYFVFSPYRNCLRESGDFFDLDVTLAAFCGANTDW